MADALIENPILNSPFQDPSRHFRFTDEGIAKEVVEGRRARTLLRAQRERSAETMVHRLTIGHRNPAAVGRRQTVRTGALETDVVDRFLAELGERDAGGNWALGGCKVGFQNASVSCQWKSGCTNRVAEEFALRLQQETNCIIADVGGYRVIEPTELVGLNGQANGVQMGQE